MATIYRKINVHPDQPSGYDNMLILEPQESILYPFDIGDYNEVRVGVIWTFTSNTGDNTGVSTSSPSYFESTYTSNIPRKSFFIGLNNNKLSIPYTSGCDFLGIGVWTGTTTSKGNAFMEGYDGSLGLLIGGYSNLSTPCGAIDLLKTHGITSFSGGSLSTDGDPGGFGGIFQFYADRGVQGGLSQFRGFVANSYISYGYFQLAYKFWQDSDDKTVYSVQCITNPYVYNAGGPYSLIIRNASNRTIKYLNSQVSTAAYGPIKTGYWTSDFTSGGSNLAKPTAFFLYNPLFLYRPRISNIIVERYA